VTNVVNKPMRKLWRTKRRTSAKKNVQFVSASLAGQRSLIKTGTIWFIAQTSAAELRSMRVSSIRNKVQVWS